MRVIKDLWHRAWNEDSFWKRPALIGFAVLLCLWISGCGYAYPFLKEPGNFACVQVVWTEQIQNHCSPGARGCATVRNGHNVGTIWARKPKAFDDYEAVCTIGHEFLHSLDATHQ